MRGYSDQNPYERYALQALRQAKGWPCSECGSRSGHFSVCPVFHMGLHGEEITMEQVLGKDKPQSDSQSFYRKVQQNRVLPEDYSPVYSEADRLMAHALGVKL